MTRNEQLRAERRDPALPDPERLRRGELDLCAPPALKPRFIPLPRSFYQPSAKIVAARLLGHWLVRNGPSGSCGGVIVETEAYLSDDPASHGFPGPTARNRVM